MKKLAIFDMDGTLFNTNDINYNAYNEALKEKGYHVDYDYYCNYCNGRHYTVFLPDLVDNNKEIVDYVHKRKKELYKIYVDKGKENIHLFNIIECIKNEYYIAIVTTASKENTFDILNYFNKADLFDLVLTSSDISNPKPDPEGFKKAIDYFNIDTKDVIIFEDSTVGIEAAKKVTNNVFKIEDF